MGSCGTPRTARPGPDSARRARSARPPGACGAPLSRRLYPRTLIGTTLVWLRDDLRLGDSPALVAAAERGGPIIVLLVLDGDPAVARRGEARAAGGCTAAWPRAFGARAPG
nr:deoxyribodipyrimidine photo-lyase [Naasia sp.]